MFHYKQKYHTGRISQENRWVFGIADTSTTPSKFYVRVVPDRRAETLIPIITEICRPGTIIWSDQWRAYNSLFNIYSHETVNHQINFVNPTNGVHTQNIESVWNKLKNKLKKMMGISSGDLQLYLNFWMYKSYYNNNDFEVFLDIFK
ncbi:hypothetical protein DMUE_1827 [Dictyocoela muelleri]|nr:hypothetical protein DMUE_1827 [Dictyocoela muelleri]